MATTVPPVPSAPLESGYDDRDRSENFPVAMRILPARWRDRLRRTYAVARHIDDLGDEAGGDRTAALMAFDDDLRVLEAGGTPHTECLRALAPTMRDCDLPSSALHDLVRANLMDQEVRSYATFDDLLGYCALSADPVGRLVLAIFDRHEPELFACSDRICSALQILEHCQDVVEDLAAGRIYLPTADLRAAGIDDDDLCARRHRDALREVVLLQVQRSQTMMAAGRPIVHHLSGWARIAVAGYLAGGLATAAALEHARGDVVTDTPRPGTIRILTTMIRLLTTRGDESC